MYVYIVARPRTREHAFRRTHYRIKKRKPNTAEHHCKTPSEHSEHRNTPEHAFTPAPQP